MRFYKKCLVISILGILLIAGISSSSTAFVKEKTSNEKIPEEDDTIKIEMKKSNNPPEMVKIEGPTKINTGEPHIWYFHAYDPDSSELRFYVNWGGYPFESREVTGWFPCDEICVGHAGHIYFVYFEERNFTIWVWAKDDQDEYSEPMSFTVTVPRTKAINHPFVRLFERFPLMEVLLRILDL